MTFASAVSVLLVVVFTAGVFAGLILGWLVRWVRDRRDPVRVVTITTESSGGFVWEAALDMGRPFAFGSARTWQEARLQAIHAVIPDVEVSPS